MSVMERIVVGADYTPAATAALRWAVQEAAQTGAAVVVVHAFTKGRSTRAHGTDLEHARRRARYRTQAWVVEALNGYHSDVPVVVTTPDGPVEQALVSAAERARLLVVGEPRTVRRRRLPNALARRCPCPVVAVAEECARPVPA